MTREEIFTRQRRLKLWRESEIGKLFEAYDAATGNAWVVDSTSNSPGRIEQAWEVQRRKKSDLLDKLCALADIENPYT